jgi:4-hydroxy-4-methyl-2-oxoglutarate aldolase
MSKLLTREKRDYADWRLQERPDRKLIDYLKTVPTAFVSDCLKRLEIHNITLRDVHLPFPLREDRVSVVGPAVTMQWAPHSETNPYYDANYLHTEIVEEGKAGDVIVLAGMGQPYGFWGEHATNQAAKQGIEAIVIDGYTRDLKPIRAMGYPVFCTGITFESYVRRCDPVGYNVPVGVAGAQVRPGDVIMGDDDGVLVIPKEMLSQVVDVAVDVTNLEGDLDKAVKSGKPWTEIYREIHHRKYYAQRPKPKGK